MQGRSILVIGDMVADIYLDGRISRISREAPVLVLEQAGEKVVAGGAANVVNNIATLGGKVHAVGLVGRDESADGLRAILAANGADVRGLIADDSRPTISKTRIIAGGRATVSQQIVRIDRESRAPMAQPSRRSCAPTSSPSCRPSRASSSATTAPAPSQKGFSPCSSTTAAHTISRALSTRATPSAASTASATSSRTMPRLPRPWAASS